jgi:hypothetical protein
MVEKHMLKNLQEKQERQIEAYREFIDKGVTKYVQNFQW